MNTRNLTYEQITQNFLEFEKKYNLLSLKISEVFPWQIARIIIFLKIVDHFIPGNTSEEIKPKFEILKNTLHRVFINLIFFNPFLDFKNKDVLVFESGRKYLDENGYIDIYTEYLCLDLKQKGISYTRYETNYNLDAGFFSRNFQVKHLDFVLLASKIRNLFSKTQFTTSEDKTIENIILDIKQEFGLLINLHTLFAEEVGRFKIERNLYEKLFKLKRPKEIYFINSCDKAALIDAAKKVGIITNELQHGLMSDKDVISNFPYSAEGSIAYFPDRFFIWDNVPMFFGKLPIKSEFIIPVQNKHIAMWQERTSSVPKQEKTILIVSQPYGSSELQNFVEDNLESLQHYTILYKLHPAENAENVLSFKEKHTIHRNIRFISNEESIYVLLKKAQFAVGIYSSALFEAPAFDCKVILLNLPGVEMSFPLLNNKNNILINTTQKLSDFL